MKASRTLKHGIYIAMAVIAVTIVPALVSASGITVYKDGDKYVKLGGRMQLQYYMQDPDTGNSSDTTTDELFFRRFRPYIEGSLHKDWMGKFQWDMGKADGENEISVEEAYFRYMGFENVDVTIGNYGFPFSREGLTSSKKKQLVETSFAGDHNYGTPSNNAGIHLTGHFTDNKLITWGLSAASSCIDPDNKKLDFDTPVNKDSDFNQGWIVGGRVDYHPFGELEFAQGDFSRELKATIGVAAFNWSNDDDNNTYTSAAGVSTNASKADVDSVTGLEISGALRYAGFSVDAEYNIFSSDTVDPTVTNGIYANGTTDLKNWMVCGGYMVVPDVLEVVAGYESQDADNYAESWNRTSMGLNWFLKKQDIKLQLTYRMGESVNGIKDKDLNEFFVQAQYVF
ncbi:MAG: porin [Syntrophales bacterium]|nr:porin [Syntrophales bacterium]